MKNGFFDDAAFLQRLREGDEGAYRRLIRRFHGPLLRAASGILGSRAHAEDVVQDTWLVALSCIASFEGRCSLGTWLFAITLNRARTHAARRGRMVAFSSLFSREGGEERAFDMGRFGPDMHWGEKLALRDEHDPERIVGGRQVWDVARKAIRQMPAAQCDVIIRRGIEGMDAEHVCSALGIGKGNQRLLLHRARGRVRTAIDQAIGNAKPATSRAPPRSAPRTFGAARDVHVAYH